MMEEKIDVEQTLQFWLPGPLFITKTSFTLAKSTHLVNRFRDSKLRGQNDNFFFGKDD